MRTWHADIQPWPPAEMNTYITDTKLSLHSIKPSSTHSLSANQAGTYQPGSCASDFWLVRPMCFWVLAWAKQAIYCVPVYPSLHVREVFSLRQRNFNLFGINMSVSWSARAPGSMNLSEGWKLRQRETERECERERQRERERERERERVRVSRREREREREKKRQQ